jgi:L-asparaginase
MIMSSLRSGHNSLAELESAGFMAIIHGGGIPEDLESAIAIEKHASLQYIVGGLSVNNYFPLESTLISNSNTAINRAEKISLRAAHQLENDPVFNAGYGAKLQADGVPRVSAAFMESNRHKLSSVANLEGVLHPSHLAYVLQYRRFSMLDGNGAARLSNELSIPRTNLITQRSLESWQEHSNNGAEAPLGKGTIGSVAVDNLGNIAVTTSTGGVGNETVGRVGDTPTVAGTYCTEAVGISCTGYGEQIVNQAFAARVAIRTEDGMTLADAMTKSVYEASNKGYNICAIAIKVDKQAARFDWVAGSTDPNFAWAINSPDAIASFKTYK